MKITFNMKRQRQRVKHFFTFPRCHQIGLADSRVKPSSRDRRRETERWTDRPKRLADRATEREDRRSILFCFMPLYSVLCLHKSEVRQIALECVNQRSWAGTRTSTRTRTDSCGSGEGGEEEEQGAWSGRVLNQLQLATLRCVDFFSAAGTADVAVAVAVGQGSDKTDYTDFMLGKSKNERAAIYILKFPPPTCPGVGRGGQGLAAAVAVAVAARIYWPHVLCYLRELYNLPFDNVYTHYTF